MVVLVCLVFVVCCWYSCGFLLGFSGGVFICCCLLCLILDGAFGGLELVLGWWCC